VSAEDLKTYELTLAEAQPPPHREGMRFTTRILRRSKRAARAGWRGFIVISIRRIP
jgi:hypothetical protein